MSIISGRYDYVAEIYFTNSSGNKEIISVCVAPPIQLTFSEAEVRIMDSYTKDFELIGIKLKPVDSTHVKVLTAPKCFAEKIVYEVNSKFTKKKSKIKHRYPTSHIPSRDSEIILNM